MIVRTVCDPVYRDRFLPGLRASVARNWPGATFEAKVLPGGLARGAYANPRYDMPAVDDDVLIVDCDSLVFRPIAMPEGCDVGVMYTEGHMQPVKACVLWVRPSGREFLENLADRIGNRTAWGADQDALMAEYAETSLTVHKFTSADVDWRRDSDPCIWTAKGDNKRYWDAKVRSCLQESEPHAL